MRRPLRLALTAAGAAGATITGAWLAGALDTPAVPDRGPVVPASWSRPQSPRPLPTDWVPAPTVAPSCPTSPDPRRPGAVRAWLADPANTACAEHLGLTKDGAR